MKVVKRKENEAGEESIFDINEDKDHLINIFTTQSTTTFILKLNFGPRKYGIFQRDDLNFSSLLSPVKTFPTRRGGKGSRVLLDSERN